MSRRRRVHRPDACPRCGTPIAWARHVPGDPSRLVERGPHGAGRVPLERAPRPDGDPLAEYVALPSLAQARHVGPGGDVDAAERRHAHHAVASPACRSALFPPEPRQTSPRRRTA